MTVEKYIIIKMEITTNALQVYKLTNTPTVLKSLKSKLWKATPKVHTLLKCRLPNKKNKNGVGEMAK